MMKKILATGFLLLIALPQAYATEDLDEKMPKIGIVNPIDDPSLLQGTDQENTPSSDSSFPPVSSRWTSHLPGYLMEAALITASGLAAYWYFGSMADSQPSFPNTPGLPSFPWPEHPLGESLWRQTAMQIEGIVHTLQTACLTPKACQNIPAETLAASLQNVPTQAPAFCGHFKAAYTAWLPAFVAASQPTYAAPLVKAVEPYLKKGLDLACSAGRQGIKYLQSIKESLAQLKSSPPTSISQAPTPIIKALDNLKEVIKTAPSYSRFVEWAENAKSLQENLYSQLSNLQDSHHLVDAVALENTLSEVMELMKNMNLDTAAKRYLKPYLEDTIALLRQTRNPQLIADYIHQLADGLRDPSISAAKYDVGFRESFRDLTLALRALTHPSSPLLKRKLDELTQEVHAAVKGPIAFTYTPFSTELFNVYLEEVFRLRKTHADLVNQIDSVLYKIFELSRIKPAHAKGILGKLVTTLKEPAQR